MAAPFIPALIVMLVITILRYSSVVLMNLANKEKPMNKLFRFTLMIASCICETLWAGIVSVVASAIPSHSELISVLAKHIDFLVSTPSWSAGVGGSNPLVPTN